jgi:uncharacterized protein YcgL (UPF0745 family)
MRTFKFVVYCLGILLIFSGLLHATDIEDGFLGLKWTTHISELKNFKKIGGKDDVGYYRNPEKKYTVFEVENPTVVYGFYKDQFFATYIAVDTFMVFSRVKNHISEKFGAPKTILKMKSKQTIYRWKHNKIKIKLKHFEKEGKMKLAFYYTPLSNQLNAAQRESFPVVPTQVTAPDNRTKQEIREDLRLQQALDVMGF